MATTTFLFVDQVGSTEQLSRLGDSVAQRVRRALFDLLRQATQVHGGREVDFTGDGLFCSFESAADAVDAAVEMQQGVTSFGQRSAGESLAIRIGLNTGEPLASEGGGHFGSAVVVASRLCSQAAPGQILASGLVRALVEPRGRHGFESVGSLALKGIPQPVETYAVAWTADDRRAFLPDQLAAARTGPFVDRTGELDRILAAWHRIADGGRLLVLISGDSGMGVTRLAAEAAERLRAAGASVWAGAAQGGDERLAAWAEAVEGWARAVSRAELRQAVADDAADLARLVPGLVRMLPRVPDPAPIDAQAATYRIADALDAVVDRWSAVEPLVIVLDRLHEADAASLTVLRRLLRSRRGGRVLVIGGYEPSSVGASRVLRALDDTRDVVDIRLEGLPEDDVGRLVAAITGEPPSDASVRAVIAETEGSPYFVLRMARSMHQQGITRRVEEAVGRAAELRSDLRLQREEIALGLRQLDEFRDEMAASDRARLDPDGTPPEPGDCPYRGLLAYTAEDADTFFGRDALVAEMVAALSVSRWLAVVGPSGSGKSSAVRAGLHPALARGALPGSEQWVVVDVRPGGHPVAALGRALAVAAEQDGESASVALLSDPLSAVAGRLFGRRRLVVHVDQFEELWTSAPPEERSRVLDLLVDAATAPGESVAVVVTMRADYYGRTAEHPVLADLMAASQVLVPPMTPAELRAAIEQPARQAGLVLEPGLAQAVVDDVAHEPGTLPLLSTAMQETWERRRGRSLTLAAYAETGGARRAIAHLADATMESLGPGQRDIARRLLVRLAAPARDGGDVARPAPVSELVVDDETRVVLDRLAERRLVTVGATTVQVAHEALLREWPRLRAWLNADREGRRLQQQVATAADDWEASGRDDDLLLRGARLAAAEEWRGEHEDGLTGREREFLDASAGLRERGLRRARRITRRFQVLAAVLVVLLAGTAVAAWLAVDSSRKESARATEAITGELVARSAALATTQPATALLLAVEAHRRHRSPETRGALMRALDASRYVGSFLHGVPGVVGSAVTDGGATLWVLTASGSLQSYRTDDWSAPAEVLLDGIPLGYGLAASPDGSRALYTDVQRLRLVDLESGGEVAAWPGPFHLIDMSPDGRYLGFVSGTTPPRLHVADMTSGSALHQFVLDDPVQEFAIRPGAPELVVVDDSGARLRRSTLDGRPLGTPFRPERPIRDVEHLPDGQHLVIGYEGGVQLVDADTFDELGEMLAWGGDVQAISTAPSGRVVSVASTDGSIRVAEVTPSGLLERAVIQLDPGAFELGPGVVNRQHWLDDRRLLAMGPEVSTEYDLSRPLPLAERLGGPPSGLGVQAVLPSADGRTLLYVAGGHLREIGVSGAGGSLDLQLPVDPGEPVSLAVSPDGAWAAIVGPPRPGHVPAPPVTDEVAVLVPLDPGGRWRELDLSIEPVPSRPLVFGADSRTLALGVTAGVTVWDVPSGEFRGNPLAVVLDVVALHPVGDGSDLLVAQWDGTIHDLDVEAADLGDPRRIIPEGPVIQATALSADVRRAAVAVGGRRVLVVDAATGRAVAAPLQAGAREIVALTFSPDGSLLAGIDDGGALYLWDLTAGRALGPPLQIGGEPAGPPAFVGDGRTIVTATAGDLLAWRLDPARWSAMACELAGRDLTREEWSTYLPDEPYRATCSGN